MGTNTKELRILNLIKRRQIIHESMREWKPLKLTMLYSK